MKTWKVLDQRSEIGSRSVEEIIEVLLKNRKVEDVYEFTNPTLEKVTLLSVGIDENEVIKTLGLIKKTIEEKKAIVVYGDYDVDGICGTAILWETMYSFYKNVHPYIPHRVDEGYGLSIKGIENITAQTQDVGLIITVDNGIVAEKPVEFAKKQGIEVVITDHHVKGGKLPRADAIVHTTELCGTGVAYLLSQKIADEFKITHPDNHLELVALATVADLVPLNKHNRTLLKFGLIKLRKTKRLGLLALFDEAKVNADEIDVYHIGHMIAPRLNASGRITHALDSLRLICTPNQKKAIELAKHLHEVNRERQQLTADSAENAKARFQSAFEENKLESLLFVEDETYEQGVVGLIASRLVEEFYRPAIAVSVGEKVSKGSARSISGVNIIELIRSVPEFLAEAGGHPMAAGFSIETEKLEDFKRALIEKADATIKKNLFDRTITIDTEVSFDDITLDLYDALVVLSPFGMGNSAPTFMTRGVSILSLNKVGKTQDHLQLMLEHNGTFYKGMKFGAGKEDIKQGQIVDIVYTIDLNDWKGNKKLELRIKDVKST